MENFSRITQTAATVAAVMGFEAPQGADTPNEIIVRKHYQMGEMRCKVETAGNHGGGDAKLAENFIGVMLGAEGSKTPLEQGLISAYMCLKARESAQTHSFVKLDYFGGK